MARYVFLDTQVFKSANFSLKNTNIKKLISYVTAGDVTLVTSPIITNEVIKHIKSDVRRLVKAISENKIFYAIPGVEKIAIEFDHKILFEQIYQEIAKNFFNSAEKVDLSYSIPGDVFKDYFSLTPPFVSGKTEFPDAFVANSLLNWAKQNRKKIAIVSGNTRDWEKLCDREEYKQVFEFYKNLSEFFASFTSITLYEKRLIELGVKRDLQQHFLAQFKDCSVTITPELLSWDDFSEPEVDYSKLYIDNSSISINIIDFDPENRTAEVAIAGSFSFWANVDIDDVNSGMYDSEEKEIIGYWDRLKGIVEAKREFSCIVTVYKEGEEYKIDSLEIDSPKSVELSWGHCFEYYDDDNFIPDPASNSDE